MLGPRPLRWSVAAPRNTTLPIYVTVPNLVTVGQTVYMGVGTHTQTHTHSFSGFSFFSDEFFTFRVYHFSLFQSV